MTKLTAQQVEEVLSFWFDASDDGALNRPREAWFCRDDAFDAEIRRRFLLLWQELAAGELAIDAGDARAALAWLIAADQFPRNLFRGEARAFSSDVLAREGARLVISQGLDQALPPVARVFVYMPFEHSEDIADQRLSLRLFQALDTALPGSNYFDYAQRHERVIAEFGRFPHRNAALGRTSTPAELSYLAQPGAGF
ncbi:DUF924 family protein [Chromobacterium violaceum]|uniref:DUF924 family protein n=1 Tax=Chromobacterium violaceum TaxID=536 RepID=UPI0005D3D241|nr:DUF924 family protein [Chromobacterium violaceum]KJH68278.1 membrane protein [Chromobacterium violaceum]